MVDEKQIKQWLKDGTITSTQAKKMLGDSSKEIAEEKSNKFVTIVATIGAILVFIGIAWLIARNWHQIPNVLKVTILIFATLASFISGVLLRQKEYDGVGRSLITLGALLYILSLFLISQIYNLGTTSQHYAWLLFFAWTIILAISYLVDSKENLIISILVFFPWAILQYLSSISNNAKEGVILGFVLIFLSAGVLLYGISILHNSIRHRFTNIYRFWVVFYFLLIFYILSFQSLLPILSGYSFETSTFSIFLIIFIVVCFFGFTIGTVFAANKDSISIKEIFSFLGILAILFILILSTKAGADLVGRCEAKSCYSFKTSADCSSAPDPLVCEWKNNPENTRGYCEQVSCYNFRNETDCNSASPKLNCNWQKDNNDCNQKKEDNSELNLYEICNKYNDQKDNCVKNSLCTWMPSYGFFDSSKGLPTTLWILWILNNFAFIGFIILMIWYGQSIGSTNIINISLWAFILEIISRYIGFWLDFKGYFAFSILAILGGLMLIFGARLIPKWRRKILEKTKRTEGLDR